MANTPAIAGDARPLQKIIVSVKKTWGDPDLSNPTDQVNKDKTWTVMNGRFIAESCSDAASPALPNAKFTWEYGRAYESPDPDLSDWISQDDLLDQFVKIEYEHPTEKGTDGKPKKIAIFFGVFAVDGREIAGSDVDIILPTGDQNVSAFGLQHLLDRVPIQDGFITNDGLFQEQIGVVPVFNERYVRGLNQIGNCSKTAVFYGGDNEAEFQGFLFSQDGELWNNRDIVEYLLTHYQPQGVKFELFDDGLGAASTKSQAKELEAIILPRVDLAGLTIKEALDRLIPRQRGLGWCLRVAEKDTAAGGTNAETKVLLHVFSVFDQDVFFGANSLSGVIVGANREIVETFDVSGLEVGDITQVSSTATAYGTIRVLGEPARAMFTLSFADSTLRIGWTAAQEANYKFVSAGSADKNDSERCTDKYAPVYAHFLIPQGWDWKAGDGQGGAKTNIPISFKANGEVDWKKASPIRKWGSARVFEDRLPIESAEKELTKAAPQFVAPFAIIKGTFGAESKYVMCHKPGVSSIEPGHVSMFDNQLGVELHYSPNHQVGKGSFDSGGPSASNVGTPKLDYHDLIVTVCCAIDARLSVQEKIAANPVDRVLTIEVADAHFWYVVPGTVLDVINGGVDTHVPTDEFSDPYPLGNVLRNDVERLKRVATLAKVWYARRRSPVNFTMREMVSDLLVGKLLVQLEDNEVFTEARTVVSEVLFDLRRRTTTITTAYGELDFGRGD